MGFGCFLLGFIASLPFGICGWDDHGNAGPSFKKAPTVHHHLEPMHEAAVKLRHDLEEYYGEHHGMLTAGWKIDPQADTYTRNQFIKSIHSRAPQFVIGTLGSSVAAGHDTCGYFSYENQLTRMLAPVFAAGGMEFVHRNAGQGGGCGDSHRNQVYCVKNLVGQDVDIVHAVWNYFGDTRDAFEKLVRWSLLLDKAPPVHLYGTGAHGRVTCFDDPPFEHYGKTWGHNGVCLESGLESGGQFHGREWGKVGDGYHNIVRGDWSNETQEIKDQLGITYNNWHPGALGHQFVADMFAYAYSGYIIDASLEDTPVPDSPVILASDLPVPLYCNPLECSGDVMPECTNFETPTYGYAGTKLVDKHDHWNPHVGEEPQGFTVGTGPGSNNLVPKEFQKYWPAEKCNFLDTCSHLYADSPGMQVFRLPQMKLGRVILCGHGKHAADEMFFDNPSLTVEIGGILLDRSGWVKDSPESKCVVVHQGFEEGATQQTEHGHLYLTLRLSERPARPFKLTHIITL